MLQGAVWQVTDRPDTSSGGKAVNGTPRRSTAAAGTPEANTLPSKTCGRNPQPLN